MGPPNTNLAGQTDENEESSFGLGVTPCQSSAGNPTDPPEQVNHVPECDQSGENVMGEITPESVTPETTPPGVQSQSVPTQAVITQSVIYGGGGCPYQ